MVSRSALRGGILRLGQLKPMPLLKLRGHTYARISSRSGSFTLYRYSTQASTGSIDTPSVSSSPGSTSPRIATVASLLHEAPIATSSEDGETVTVNGWIRSNRNMKNYSFLHIGDGTTTQPLQAVIPKELFPDVKSLTTGTCIQITGEWKTSPGAKRQQQARELQYQSLKILGPSDPETYPLQKKYHSPEFLRSLPHLRSRLPSQAALLQLRSWITAHIVNFFSEKEFVQVHPPIITSSDCEGAGEVFTVSTSPDPPPLGSPPSSALTPKQKEEHQHFFRAPKYLTVSSQLHLETFAHAIPKVWTLSPTFRAEKSDTNRHLSEFYMLEAEIAFTETLEDVMSLVEDLTRYIVSGLVEARVGKEVAQIYAARSEEEVARDAGEMGPGKLEDRWASLLTPQPWRRMTYTEAIDLLNQAVKSKEVDFVFEPIWGNALQAEHEKFLAKKFGGGDGTIGGPVFVTDYPKEQKPFYMLPSLASPDKTVACFDLLLPHIGELVGGSLREHRYEEIIQAMKTHGIIPETDQDGGEEMGGMKWYADLRKWGSVAHGGFGMGFDRMLAYLAGIRDVREVVGFPRWSGRCDC